MVFKYKYCVAAMESNYDGSGQYHAAFYAFRNDQYGLHKTSDPNDKDIIWYDTENEAKAHIINSNDCVLSRCFE